MSGSGEGSMDKIISEAVNADVDAKRKGDYEKLGLETPLSHKEAGLPQPVVQKNQETIRENPLEKEIQEAALVEKRAAAARKFRHIESSASDPKPQGV